MIQVCTERKSKEKNKIYWIIFCIAKFNRGSSVYIASLLDVILRSFQSAISRDFIGVNNYIDIFNNLAFKLAASNL